MNIFTTKSSSSLSKASCLLRSIFNFSFHSDVFSNKLSVHIWIFLGEERVWSISTRGWFQCTVIQITFTSKTSQRAKLAAEIFLIARHKQTWKLQQLCPIRDFSLYLHMGNLMNQQQYSKDQKFTTTSQDVRLIWTKPHVECWNKRFQEKKGWSLLQRKKFHK